MAAIHAAFAALVTIAGIGPAMPQSYPTKPIRLIVPFPAGGPVDVMGRLVGQRLSASVGTVVVENKPGQGGTVGARFVATAEPDGATLLLASSTTMGVSVNLYKNLDFDPVKSFAPVALISTAPFVLVVRPTLNIKTTQELIAYAKANPGKLNFGFPTGTLPHLTGELFKMQTGIDIAFIPYKGAANTISDLLGGQIDFAFEPVQVLLSHIQDSAVRPLGITSAKRNPKLPDVPTLSESGLPGFLSVSWTGVVAPAGTPPAIVAQLNAAVNAELRAGDLRDTLARLGTDAKAGTPEEFGRFIADEGPKWARVVKSSGMSLQ